MNIGKFTQKFAKSHDLKISRSCKYNKRYSKNYNIDTMRKLTIYNFRDFEKLLKIASETGVTELSIGKFLIANSAVENDFNEKFREMEVIAKSYGVKLINGSNI